MNKILIIEDEDSLRQALSDKLSRHGLSVIEAKNGLDGLDLALKEKPDLILLDIIMPEQDGFVVLEKIRLDPWGKTAKVIILSNLNDQAYLLKSFRYEVYDYIIKSDVKIETLVKTIISKL